MPIQDPLDFRVLNEQMCHALAVNSFCSRQVNVSVKYNDFKHTCVLWLYFSVMLLNLSLKAGRFGLGHTERGKWKHS